MRLGVISDVHGNLPALEAVMAKLANLAVTTVVNLGDCASGPLWPADTVRVLRASGMSHVRGNHDRALGAASPDRLGSSDAFAWRNLDPEDRIWLAMLPSETVIGRAHCFHASPASDETYLIDEVQNGRLVLAQKAMIDTALSGSRFPILLCGHSHQQRIVWGSSGGAVINPGSVGNPAYRAERPTPHTSESEAPHARFAVVTISDPIEVEHYSVAYDWEVSARRAEANGRSDWADALRTGAVRPK
jgi:predicted phosphodiesterase